MMADSTIANHPDSVQSFTTSLRTLFQKERPPVRWLSIKSKNGDSSAMTKEPIEVPSEEPTELTPLGLVPTNLKHHIIHEVIAEEKASPGPWLKRDTFIREIAFEMHHFDINLTCDDIIVSLNPYRNMPLWTVINGILLLSTILIPLFLWIFDKSSRVHMEIMRFYIGYSLFNCTMWLLEAFLRFLYDVRGQNWTLWTVMEISIAFYCLYVTGAILTMNIKHREEAFKANDIRFDMIMNFVAYLWMFMACLFEWRTGSDYTLLEEHFARQQGEEENDQIHVVV